MSIDTTEETQPLRYKLVDEATKFLKNPAVLKHSAEQKSAFLRKKGLSEVEITAAYEKAQTHITPQIGAIVAGEGSLSGYPNGPLSVPSYILPQPPSGWVRVRDACNLVLILSGASYGLYLLYQKWMRPWLTGRREKTVEESVAELQQSVVTVLKEVQTTLQSLQLTLSAQSAHIQALGSKEAQAVLTPRQLDHLKTEISSLKGLMIGKRTFPSTPSLAPSIPSWQLSKAAGKPLDAAPQTILSVPNQAEVTEAADPVASVAALQEDHFTCQPTDAEILQVQAARLENGEVRDENGEVRGEGGEVGGEDHYGSYESDCEEKSF